MILSAVLGSLGFLHSSLTATTAYTDSLAMARSSPDVQKLLGDGIHVKPLVFGYALPFADPKFAQWSVKLGGSRGSGHLYGIANRINDSWEFSRLVFVSDDGGKRFNLAPVPFTLGLPPVPAKKVFLVPLGLSASESLDWAPAYYQAKLGIDVAVLPPIPLDPKLEDSARHQLDSDKCVDYILHSYPDIAGDPSNTLVGVTSRDIYIPGYNWAYAENMRVGDHAAIVSSARLHPPSFMDRRNPEWLNSRLQKLLTKNLVILYFDLPMSGDYTSLLSGGVLSGEQIDRMGGQIIGAEGRWDPLSNQGEPAVTLYDFPGKPVLWRLAYEDRAIPDTSVQLFMADLGLGTLTQRQVDFVLDGTYPLEFTRVYTTNDSLSRSFGVGAMHSLDIFLAGQMGTYVELSLPDGTRVHFDHAPQNPGQPFDVYRVRLGGGPFGHAEADYAAGLWRVKRADGWTLFFPYRPRWPGQYVTVLTSFSDPAGHMYAMQRDQSSGDLLSITTPSGAWLHFENDDHHHIRRITSSTGRVVNYDYDPGGRLIRVTDSEGRVETYTYDERNCMLMAGHGAGAPILTNEYTNDGYVKVQVLGDGRRFEYASFRGPRNVMYETSITLPNGMITSIQYGSGAYIQSLPSPVPR
ncbi:MAG: cytochrome c oxidase assembly factor Coa1 family protein [Candidatus Acidiferrales bacterium]